MRASLDSVGRYEGMICIPWRRARAQLAVVAMLLVAGLLYAPRAGAYEQYHPGDASSAGDGCFQCHGWDDDLNPAWVASENNSWRNGGFDSRAALHDMHVSQITGNCDLCHVSAGDGGFTYTSGDPDGEGCRGCHGVDNGTLFNWSAGLRTHHTNAGAPADQDGLFCDDCHGSDPAPQSEDTVPVYYLRADVNAKDSCNADGTEDWGARFGEPADVPDGFGLDNDGDLFYDGDDPDCGAPDSDGDGIADAFDNCLDIANGPSAGICYSTGVQVDTDENGFGDPCDGDFTQDGAVNSSDVVIFFADLAAGTSTPGTGTDMNCDGAVNSSDVVLFGPQIAQGFPGP